MLQGKEDITLSVLTQCFVYTSIMAVTRGFPHSSVGKESACNAGDPGSIPRSGRFAREEMGFPLQYSWASLMAQLVKNPPAMWEIWVGKIPWRTATYSSILAWRIPWTV